MPELTRRRRTLILAICCSSLFMVSLDNTIVNLALPSIQRELGSSLSALQWTVDAYTLVIACLLLLSGSTADRIGRRRVFRPDSSCSASALCCAARRPRRARSSHSAGCRPSAARCSTPSRYPSSPTPSSIPVERARAIGVWGAVIGVSMSLGPVLGGVLVDGIGWRSVFWINVPVAVAAVVLCARFVPESRAARARHVDPLGQLLVVVLLGGLVFGIIEGPNLGWTSPAILVCFAAAVVAGGLLVRVESRMSEPLIDPRFFRSIPFSAATLTAVCAFAALSGFLFLNALYLQDVRGYTPLHAGLLTLPMAVMAGLLPPVSARLVSSRGARVPLLIAGAGIASSTLLLALVLRAGTPIGLLVVAYVLFGVGFGMVNAPITNTAVAGMPRSQSGVAGAVASTSRQTGAALGVAVLGSLVTSSIVGPFAAGFAAAARPAWVVMTGCGLAIVVLGILATGRRAVTSADRAAALLDEPTAPPITAAAAR